MSLFKTREWWSTVVGNKEEFDQGCLCVANVDNSCSAQGKWECLNLKFDYSYCITLLSVPCAKWHLIR